MPEIAHPIHKFEDNAALASKLALRIAHDLEAAIAIRGKATLAVSGGTTPVPLFKALSQQPLDWQHVSITQVDERWVGQNHADANAGLIQQHLLQNRASCAHFISMKTEESSPFEAQQTASKKLSAFAEHIDVVLLGMGEDGHTASFFPGANTLPEALNMQSKILCVAVTPPRAAHDRMTLCLPAILSAQNLYLHITGTTKLAILQQAYTDGAIEDLPIRAVVRAAQTPLEIYYAKRN